MKPCKVTLETADGESTTLKFRGTLRLVLTDDSNRHHKYDVKGCVYDPSAPMNVLGVPYLGKHHFKDQADANSLYDEDGTTIKSGSTKAHFVWDHGKHERHFFIGDSDLPELYLYVGQGYFKAFCTRVRKYFDDQVIHAFSSALSIDPAIDTDMPCPEGDDLQNPWEDPPHQWYCPEIVTGTVSQAPSSNDKPTKPNSGSCDFKLVWT